MVQTVRRLAILVNLAAVGYLFYLINKHGVNNTDEWGIIIMWVLLIITNSSAIYLPQSSVKEENIFGLWLRVKKAELKRRLDES